MSKTGKVRVGILGTSHVHAPTYLHCLTTGRNATRVEIAGIYDNSGNAKAGAIAAKRGLPILGTPQEVLAERPDFVMICTENARHIEMFRLAAAAGIDVLCEKPLATTVRDMDEMLRTSREAGIKLMTTFPNRYIHSYRSVKATYDAGGLGRLLGVKATNKGEMPGGWFVDPALSGGGCIIDHTVHVADLINHLLGEMPVSVRASSARRLYDELAVEDVALVSFVYRDGTFVTLDASWSRTKAFPYARDLTLQLVGDRASANVHYFAESNEVFSEEAGTFWSYYGEDKDRMMLEDVAGCYLEGRDFPITGLDGYRSTMVALAAYRSAAEGRTVRIEELGGAFR